MDKVEFLYKMLESQTPFCFLKLNDGECLAMENQEGAVISRGDQYSSQALSEKLIEALNYEAPNYFIGLPCQICCHKYTNIIQKYLIDNDDVDLQNDYLNANILINSNVNETIDILQNTLSDENKHVVVITNKNMAQNIDNLAQLGIIISQVIEVSDKNAFDEDYENIKDIWITIPDNAYIICLCGPLGRVLCYEWYKNNATFTCLELGSLFDPLLKNRSYSYHQNTIPYCSGCNPTNLNKKAFDEWIPDYLLLQNECFYLHDIPSYLQFFNQDVQKVRDTLLFRFKTELENPLYARWIQELDNFEEEIKNPLKTCLNKYKKMTRSQMFKEIKILYSNRELSKLEILTDLYLEYFKHLDDADVMETMFYNGFSTQSTNKEKSVNIYEELYKNKKIDSGIKFYTMCNLEILYPKKNMPIPKIIHLIYFKERELCSYNWRCIESMLKYMPDYKIIIHNDIEPVGNECWDKIKQHSDQIEIRQRERPRQFDGLDLHHVQYQADISRLEILYEYGGVYLDLDILLIRNFEELFKTNKDFYISKESNTENSGLINSFLAAKPGIDFLKIWLDNFKTGLRMDCWAYHIRETNKQLIDNNPHYMLKYNIQIMENIHFFPISWTDRGAFENTREVIFEEKTYGIHLFDTILHNVLVKNEFFPNLI